MRRLSLALLALTLAGCGSSAPPPAGGTGAERKWASDALQIVIGLDEALPRISRAGVGGRTLTDISHLYEALLGYAYVDGCGKLLEQLGEPPARTREAAGRLERACAHLHHAAGLFSDAVDRGQTALLVRAASEALGTEPLLRRARALLTPLA